MKPQYFIQHVTLRVFCFTKLVEYESGCWYVQFTMTRSFYVQKRYNSQMNKLGGVQFRRENSKNDFDFIVRVHPDSTREHEECSQNQFGQNKPININGQIFYRWTKLRKDSCHIYLLQYRADDAIFANKTGFDQLVSEMDKADVVKIERQLAQRKHDRKKFFRVHKKSDLIRTDLAHG